MDSGSSRQSVRFTGQKILGLDSLVCDDSALQRRGPAGIPLDAGFHLHSHRAHGVVVSHPLSMREALGSIPSVSTCRYVLEYISYRHQLNSSPTSLT